jgi:hypothetical protein
MCFYEIPFENFWNLYIERICSIWFLNGLLAILSRRFVRWRHVILSKHEDRLARLEERLRRAQVLTPGLVSDLIAAACTCLPLL